MNQLIISIEEARDTLRVDGNDNDTIINSLIEAIPHYLETTTGKSWVDDESVNPLAKTAAKFILMLWYNPQNTDVQKIKDVVNGLLVTLTALGRGQ